MHRDLLTLIRGLIFSASFLAALVTVALVANVAVAQNPFADNPFGPMDPDPMPPTDVQPPDQPGPQPIDVDALAAPPSPVVKAIRDANPTTPDELCWAIGALLDVRAYTEANLYIGKLMAANLDDAALAALTRKYGNGLFFKIASRAELPVAAREFGSKALAAAQKEAQSPAVLARAISNLSGASPERNAGLVDLRAAGDAGMAAVVAALGDPSLASKHPAIRSGIAELGDAAAGPLLAALQSDDANLRSQAMVLLGKIKSKPATPYLLYPAISDTVSELEKRSARYALLNIVGELPTRYDALVYLRLQSHNYLNGQLPYLPDSQGRIQFWLWNPKAKAPEKVVLPAEQIAVMVGKTLAAQLYELDEESALAKRLYLITQMEAAKRALGLEQPLPLDLPAFKAAAQFSAAELADALEQAIKEHHIRAAVGLLEVLKVVGDSSLLVTTGKPYLVAELLRHPNRHVRFAAVDAILTWDPKEPFPGSSEVVNTLARLAYQDNFDTGLVVTPHVSRGRNLAAMLSPLNIETKMATNGNDALRLAFVSGDFRLILISDSVSEPTAGELLQQIRKDPRTAAVPVGLMVREENLPSLERLADQDPLTTAFLRPFDEETMAFQIRRVLAPAELSYVSADARRLRSCWALEELDRLCGAWKEYPFYDLLRAEDALCRTLLVGGCTDKAIKALGKLATHKAQKALIDFASGAVHTPALRAAAVDAFAAAVNRRGILLTTDEITLQYDRYNQSRDLDRVSQTILGSVLDAIEAPTQAAVPPAASETDTAG